MIGELVAAVHSVLLDVDNRPSDRTSVSVFMSLDSWRKPRYRNGTGSPLTASAGPP